MADLTKWSWPSLRDLQNRQHMDYVIQRRLCTVPNGGEYFVHASGYRNFPDRYTYRAIQEYCDEGDLAAVRSRYPNGVPEPIIWRFLEQLAISAIVMEQGSLDGSVEDWQQVVHYDFKSDNVFLTSSTAGAYPSAKLADFEMALQTSEADPFNPHVLRAVSANGLSWAAPEARTHDSRWMCIKVSGKDVGYLDDEQLLAPGNIWGIGVCAWELMNGDVDWRCYEHGNEEEWDEVEYSEISMKHDDPFYEYWDPAALKMYSSHLVDVVNSCLRDHPSDRVTPIGLLAVITDDLPGAEDNEDETVADRWKAQSAKADRDGLDVDAQWPAFVGSRSVYRLGFSMQDIAAAMEQSLAAAP